MKERFVKLVIWDCHLSKIVKLLIGIFTPNRALKLNKINLILYHNLIKLNGQAVVQKDVNQRKTWSRTSKIEVSER